MANKRITDVGVVTTLDSDESFFINKNNAIKQIKRKDIVVSVSSGGTGATTVAGARNALGLGNTDGALPIANGGTGGITVEGARKNLGLGHTSGALPIANGGTGATTKADARDALGLGCNDDGALLISNGGTGATTKAAARSNLGAVSMVTRTTTLSVDEWSDNKQTKSVSGVTEDNTVFISPVPNSHTAYYECGIYCSAQSSGELTFTCVSKPKKDIKVNIVIFS